MIFSISASVENSLASAYTDKDKVLITLSFRLIFVPLSKFKPSASDTSYSPYHDQVIDDLPIHQRPI